jgi:hypothetical protein
VTNDLQIQSSGTTRLTINQASNVNAAQSLSIAGNLVNGFFFNIIGNLHADINDYNAPTGFECFFFWN